MPLPLVARKSLRDNEEKLTEAVEAIKSTLGVEWTFEFDFETILAKTATDASWLSNDLGFFYKDICSGVADCVKRACANDITKEALIEANTNNKVVVRVNEDKKNNEYWKYIFENGSLVLLFKSSIANVSDCSYYRLENIIPTPGVYSLPARLSLKENQEKFDEAFERIKNSTKEDWSLDEESLEKVYTTLEKDTQSRIGEVFGEILNYIANNIETRCKDDMVLEAFNEVTTGKKIVFRHNTKASDYWVWSFEGGNLIITYRSICNISDNSYYNFEKLL